MPVWGLLKNLLSSYDGSAQKRTTKQICISPYNVPMTSWIATPNLSLHFLNTRGICCTATPKHTLEFQRCTSPRQNYPRPRALQQVCSLPGPWHTHHKICAQSPLKGLKHCPFQMHIFSSFPWVLNPSLMKSPLHVTTALVMRMDCY